MPSTYSPDVPTKAPNLDKRVWRPDVPFDALPLLPPEAELETRAVLNQCIAARAALAELKQAAELIPNQSSHSVFPFGSRVPSLLVSRDSFQVRGGDCGWMVYQEIAACVRRAVGFWRDFCDQAAFR